jgi:hypothetical protein
MTTAEELRREAKRQWYQKNKEQVQKARIFKQIQDGRKVKKETLDKYNIKTKKGKIDIPAKPIKIEFKKKPKDTTIEAVSNPIIQEINDYDQNNTKFTAEQFTNYIEGPLRKTQPILTSKTREQYARLPEAIFEMYGQTYDKNKDLTEWLTNGNKLIKAFENKKSWKSDETKSKNLGALLRLSNEFMPYKNALSDEDRQILDSQMKVWKQIASDKQEQKNQNTSYPEFFTLRNAVLKKYGKNSYEYLYYLLYDVIIPRDDLNSLIIIDDKSKINNTENYLYLNNNEGEIILNEYKTKGKYNQRRFKLTTDMIDIIKTQHKKEKEPVNRLFMNVKGKKLTNWVPTITQDILKSKGIGITDLRHSAISSSLLKVANKSLEQRAKMAVELANKAMNSISTARKSYISPLTRLDGTPFVSVSKLKEANEKIQHAYNTRSKAL